MGVQDSFKPVVRRFDVMTQLVEGGRNLTLLFVIRPHLHPQNPR